MNCYIIDIPPEILSNIGTYLDHLDAILLSRTCWFLYSIIKTHCKIDTDMIDNTNKLWAFLAKKGYLSLMEILSNKIKIDKCVINIAARNGHLDILIWA